MAAALSSRCSPCASTCAASAHGGGSQADFSNKQSKSHYIQQSFCRRLQSNSCFTSFKATKSFYRCHRTCSRGSVLASRVWVSEVCQTPFREVLSARTMPSLGVSAMNRQTLLPPPSAYLNLHQCKFMRPPVLGGGALVGKHARVSSTKVSGASFNAAKVSGTKVSAAGFSGAEVKVARVSAKVSGTSVRRAGASSARFSGVKVSGAKVSVAKVSGARVCGVVWRDAEVIGVRVSSSASPDCGSGMRQRGGVVSATRRSVTFKDPIEVSVDSATEGAELGFAPSQGVSFDTDGSVGGDYATETGSSVNEAPKRRRRTAAPEGEGKVKRAYVRRKKVSEGAESENGAAASNGRSKSEDLGVSGVNGLRGSVDTGAVASVSGQTARASGVKLENDGVNGAAAVEENVNGLPKRRGRRKAGTGLTSDGGETSGLDSDGVESESDGDLGGVHGAFALDESVNGRKRAASRRRGQAAELKNENGKGAEVAEKTGTASTAGMDSDGADVSNADVGSSSGRKRPPAGRRRKTKGMDSESKSETDSDDLRLHTGGVVNSDDSDGEGTGVSGTGVSGTGVSESGVNTASVPGNGVNGRVKPVRRKQRSPTTSMVSAYKDAGLTRIREADNGVSRNGLSNKRPVVASDGHSAGSQGGFSEAVARSAQNGYQLRDFDSEGGFSDDGVSDNEVSDPGVSDDDFSDAAVSDDEFSADGFLDGAISDAGVSKDAPEGPSPIGRKTVVGRRKSTATGPRSKASHKNSKSELELEPLETVTGYPLPAPPVFEPAPRRILDAPTVPAKKPPKSRPKKGGATAGFVKEKLSQGLAMVSGNAGTDGEIDNSIDPHRLVRGELVVHKKVGIGRFRELRSENVEGRAAPVLFVYLEYADGLAKLPAHQANRLLYRYRSPGVEGKEPALSKLKDRRAWERRKSKGRAHIQKMVINILKLYRLRAAVTRPPYPPDDEGQARFEATFTYQPTEHQQQAFDAVRDDMCNKTVPMDRIVCGDVGFGKTEVALRAIFRAANAGRQVAVLAPTTVLAKQHYDVVVDRFKAFPEIEIAMLSRLAGEKEKKIGLDRMSKGLVQVAVGTHALLGENVQFKDLGLLVVDEEQRFGVRQKERMKDMKTEIDVLTLSATPIPRTLEQATRGLKDLSLIATPPPSRRPIITHLQQYDDKLVEWAIERELERGGQVFYIVPRIHGGKNINARSITDVKDDLKKTMPDVTVDMAHGQMSGPELERSMRAFRDGKTQILLCTSIVESGLDIPNCNTIIITEVEKFGLAQIYQLRGRVGRSSIEAHAYLLYSVENREELNPAAELRLQALEECVDLGAGVHVAQRDLTIRGTGEVFGEKQSGKLSSEIGADLFNEMLFDSLYRAQTETLPKVDYDDVKVDFVVDTLVPHDYIDCTEGRDQFLEDMEKAARGGVDSANEFYLEMEERLGPPPPGAKRRLQMLVMKQLAAALGITRIRTRPKFVLFETSMSIGAFQMLFDAIDEERAVDIKNNLIYKEGSAGFLLKSLLGLPPEKEAQDAFECLLEMSKGLDSFMNLERSSEA